MWLKKNWWGRSPLHHSSIKHILEMRHGQATSEWRGRGVLLGIQSEFLFTISTFWWHNFSMAGALRNIWRLSFLSQYTMLQIMLQPAVSWFGIVFGSVTTHDYTLGIWDQFLRPTRGSHQAGSLSKPFSFQASTSAWRPWLQTWDEEPMVASVYQFTPSWVFNAQSRKYVFHRHDITSHRIMTLNARNFMECTKTKFCS